MCPLPKLSLRYWKEILALLNIYVKGGPALVRKKVKSITKKYYGI